MTSILNSSDPVVRDIKIALILGFMSAIFAAGIVYNSGYGSFWPVTLIILPLFNFFIVFLPFQLWRRFLTVRQFSKFLVLGVLNVSIDFGLLNFLSFFTGVTYGLAVGGINAPGFALTVISSYIGNRYWVFGDDYQKKIYKNLPLFLAVVLSGFAFSNFSLILITEYLHYHGSFQGAYVLNLAKAAVAIIQMCWNFLGFKYLVFKKM